MSLYFKVQSVAVMLLRCVCLWRIHSPDLMMIKRTDDSGEGIPIRSVCRTLTVTKYTELFPFCLNQHTNQAT